MRGLGALLAAALLLTAFAPAARAEDGSEAIYNQYWRQYTGCAYLPKTETVIDSRGESEEYRFEYELRFDAEQFVKEIIGRKYDEAGTLVEQRSYDRQGIPTRLTVYRDGAAAELAEYSYLFDGNMYMLLAEERVTDLATGEVRCTEYYRSPRGSAVPVPDGWEPGFAYDAETRRIEGGSWWEEPFGSAAVLSPDGAGGRIWEGMKQKVTWPWMGTLDTEACYERLPSGERGALLASRCEYRGWFDGPYYILRRDFTGEDELWSEDIYTYESAVNCVTEWMHRDNEGETFHRYSFAYYDGRSVREDEWIESRLTESEEEDRP